MTESLNEGTQVTKQDEQKVENDTGMRVTTAEIDITRCGLCGWNEMACQIITFQSKKKLGTAHVIAVCPNHQALFANKRLQLNI